MMADFSTAACGDGTATPAPPRKRRGIQGALALILLLAGSGAAVAQSQPAGATPLAPAVTQSQGSTQTQSVTVQAGIGMLLQLPAPAATVLSANPDVARVQPASPTSLFLMGVAPGRTTVLVTAQSGAAIIQYDVNVTPGNTPPPAGAAGPTTQITVGGAGGAAPSGPAVVTPATAAAIENSILQSVVGAAGVRVRAAGTSVVLSGTIGTAAAAEAAASIARGFTGDRITVVNDLVVLGSIQVNVRVRFAEIDRTVTRQLGFNWQALGKGTNWSVGVLTGAAASGAISPLLPLGTAALTGGALNQVGGGFTSGSWDVNGIIDALAADQLVTILAEPNLTAQSGETASFLAGGEFPIPVGSTGSGGSTTVTVEFKQFGVSLAVVPTVLSPTRVNLRVRPEVSELSTQGAVSVPIAGGTLTIPALTVRRAETTVELGSGQSFAIAGLLERTSTDVTNALPGIGELPVLGALFKSNDFQRGQSELVIIVTPYIVKPAPSPDALELPTDGFEPATDLDRILLGHQLAPAAGKAPLDAGFILK